jgi:hypothetical protein
MLQINFCNDAKLSQYGLLNVVQLIKRIASFTHFLYQLVYDRKMQFWKRDPLTFPLSSEEILIKKLI